MHEKPGAGFELAKGFLPLRILNLGAPPAVRPEPRRVTPQPFATSLAQPTYLNLMRVDMLIYNAAGRTENCTGGHSNLLYRLFASLSPHSDRAAQFTLLQALSSPWLLQLGGRCEFWCEFRATSYRFRLAGSRLRCPEHRVNATFRRTSVATRSALQPGGQGFESPPLHSAPGG